jgi:hypothetical protein
MKITTEFLKKITKAASKSRPDEIGCDECFDKLDKFAELKLEGKSPEEALPLVQDHLNKCGECRQEFEVLLEALKAEKAS